MTDFNQKGQTVDTQYNAEQIDKSIHVGLNEEKAAEMFAKTIAEKIPELQRSGKAEAAVKSFFEVIEQENIPIEQWEETLQQYAEGYIELKQKSAQLDPEDPQVKLKIEQAKQARGPAGIRVIFSHLAYNPLNYIATSTITLSNQTALVPLFALSSAQNYRVVRNAHSDTAMYEVRPVKALNLAT